MVTVVTLGFTFLLFLQSHFLSARPQYYVRQLGWPMLLLALASSLLCLLLGRGEFVLSPEFTIVIVQGVRARLGLEGILLCFATAAGLATYVAHCRKQPIRHPSWLTIAGPLVGIFVGASCLQVLNPHEPAALRAYCYDLWSPALLIWIIACLTEFVCASLDIGNRGARVCVFLFLLVGLAYAAISRGRLNFEYASPSSLPVWIACFWIGLPALMIICQLAFNRQGLLGHITWRLLTVVSTVVAFVSVGTIALWRMGHLAIPFNNVSAVLGSGLLLLVWSVLIPLAGRSLYRKYSSGDIRLTGLENIGRAQYVLGSLSSVAIILSLCDAFHFGLLDPRWDHLGSIIGLVTLVEVAEWPLWAWLKQEGAGQVTEARSPLAAFALVPPRILWDLFAEVGGGVIAFFHIDSTASAILRLVAAVVLLVAVAEIPNAGRTIVEPFTTIGLPDTQKALGGVVADRIANTLGRLGQEFRADLLLFNPSGRELKVSAEGEQTESLQIAGKSNVQILGTLTIPFVFFLAPIQSPVRRLLGVRVIHGSVEKQGQVYVLLAGSTSGEFWRERDPIEPPPPPNFSEEQTEPNVPQTEPSVLDGALAQTINNLAFKIFTRSAAPAGAGMTSSWRAIEPFRRGLSAWREFDPGQNPDYEALRHSIKEFQQAIAADPNFALAYYRLGRALELGGQSDEAIEAFRQSLTANPRFGASYIALADALYNYDAYCCSDLAPQIPKSYVHSTELQAAARSSQAREAWQDVIQLTDKEVSAVDRATAFSWLARVILDYDSKAGLSPVPLLASRYLSYFYAKRAEHLYLGLSPALRADPQVQVATATVLYQLGFALQYNEMLAKKSFSGWQCSDPTVGHLSQRSAYTPSALRYFLRALELQPTNPDLLCAAATASWASGDKEPMRLMELYDDRAHIHLADALADEADQAADDSSFRRAAGLYHQAIREYDAGIKLAPLNIDLLNGYAYLFWRWQYKIPPQNDSSLNPSWQIASNAETYARQAVRLAARSKNGLGATLLYTIASSTLGEVLLGRSRPHEAIDWLIAANKAAESFSEFHRFIDEIRWDLGAAYICVKQNDNAVSYLDKIREDESSLGVQPFTSLPHLLDVARSQNICTKPPETAIEQVAGHQRFELNKNNPIEYAHHPSSCQWSGVIGTVKDEHEYDLTEFVLHVWGGGVDRRVFAGKPFDDILLTSTKPAQTGEVVLETTSPKQTAEYYFTQLEDKQGTPVSRIYSIPTSGKCDENQITLHFVRMPS
jgi:tetratricopeptide (TPR) repeat protein